ncbi:hypothetical protein BsWGS_18264 [Bradybaena similaris]
MEQCTHEASHTKIHNNNDKTKASPATVSDYSGGHTSSFETVVNITDVFCEPDKHVKTFGIQRRSSVSDFAEKIRQLEIEGNKLREATVLNLGNINGFSFDANNFEIPKVQSPSLDSLSALIDISAEQKFISDLRTQLEKQSKETERLQRQLGDVSTFYSSSTSLHSGSPNMCPSFDDNLSPRGNKAFIYHTCTPEKAFSVVSNSELRQPFSCRNYDYEPPPHLQRSLKESQEYIMELRKKLQELSESSEQQKRQFSRTVDDLKSKLHDTILNRDTVLELRQKESNSQELLINKLQSSLTQLQEKYTLQEEALVSVSKKLEVDNHNDYLVETSLSQIRNIIIEREKRRGQPYFEAEPAASQSAVMLAHTFETCLQELDHVISVKDCRVLELEADMNEIRKQSADREKAVTKDYQEMITEMHAEHAKVIADLTESAAVAKQQVTALQNQLVENETIGQHDIQAKVLEIKDLQDKIDELKTDHMKVKALWQEKLIEAKHDQVATERLRQALESSLDQIQRELVETKAEKNDLIRSETALHSQLEDFQSLANRYETDLETERDRIQQQRKREEDLRSQVMSLEMEITNKVCNIERLEKMLEVVKQECSAAVFDRIASTEKLERDHYLDQIKTLTSQLSAMTERCNKVIVEQQLARSQTEDLRSQVQELVLKLDKTRSQMESVAAEKRDLKSLLEDKQENLDRLHREKECYVKMAEQQADEVTELKTIVDKLKSQLDEKERIFSTFSQQSSSINHLMEVNAKANENIKEDREKLSLALEEKTSQVEALKASLDKFNKKLKAREKRIQDLEDERLKITGDLISKNQEFELLQQEKENIFKELKNSRIEVANLVSRRDVLKKEVIRSRTIHSKEIHKLQTKLKEYEQGYRLSQKALRSKDMTDHKAVKFADKIQKEITIKRSEIDLLVSKLHHFEENLEAVTEEKMLLEKDKESLKRSLAKTLLRTQELSDELEKSEGRKRELVLQVAKLKEQMEQATMAVSAASAVVEKYQQEITTLKLRHQLDLKEAERLGRVKNGNTLLNTCSSTLASDSSAQQKNNICTGKSPNIRRELTGFVNDGCHGDTPGITDYFQVKDAKHKDYTKVGKELKSLVADMRSLISRHNDDVEYDTFSSASESDEAVPRRDPVKKNRDSTKILTSSLQTQGLRLEIKLGSKTLESESDVSKSWSSESPTKLGDLSDFSLYKEWRPRSSSLTQTYHPPPGDSSFSRSFLSKEDNSDNSNFSSAQKATKRSSSMVSLAPDTQELCRRLEEKIDSLTRMGDNLVKENQEMAELIGVQGEKLNAVKEIERKSWEKK